MLKRPPTSTTSTSYTKDIKAIDADDSKSQNNVDLSWLPNYNENTNSNSSGHQNGQQEFDDSWLPNYNDTKRNVTTTPSSKSNNSNRSRKAKIDSDDSWLPSTTIVKNENKNKGRNHSHDSWLPNYNYTNKNSLTAASGFINSNHLRKTENDSDDSWLPNNGCSENKKEKNRKNLRNNGHWDRACEVAQYSGDRQVQHAKVLKNRPESSTSQQQVLSSKAECIVETDSLGGVSTLLRKWKVLDETINSNHSSSDTNNTKLRSTLTSPNRTSDVSFSADLESCKSNPSMPLACLTSSRGTNHSKATDTQKEKTRVVDTVRKLSIEEEELAASEAATNNLDGQQAFMGENRCFSPVIGKTRLIRGHQAFNDFLYVMEQDRLRELESLTQRKPVSKFRNRGRIQASLRVRLIRLGAEPEKEAKSHNKRSVSRTMKTIWDKFSAGVKQGTSASRKVNNNEQETKCHALSECSVGCNLEREVEVSATTITKNQEKESVTTCDRSAQTSIDHHELKESTIDQSQDIDSSLADSIQPKEDTHYGLNDSIQLHSEMGLDNFHNWISEYSQSQSDWDEDEEFYYNHDWISEIARPKSDWEYLRQKRHQEMLYMYSYNQDLQQLLQRKSVSSFLSSGERDKLDQLMVSRAQGDAYKQEFAVRESRKQEVGGRSTIERNNSEYNDQTTCLSTPAQPKTWSHPTPDYDSNKMISPSPLWQNNPPQSSSTEMELIYDLRGYVEQLHQEIIELRKSINMQHLEAEKNKSERISTKRNCYVCYAVQADSFLYRCGHMCTCYNCGLELQYTSGKCPICEAPIVDVVRAYGYDE